MAGKDDQVDAVEVIVCANYLKALGDPYRLQIAGALQNGAISVWDLALLLD